MSEFVAGNQIKLLRDGAEYFPALEAAIEAAEFEIYLQTYIFEADETGLRIGNALKRAALRGVYVYMLLDGFGSKDLPKTFIIDLENSGIEVLIFRPKISPWTLQRSRLRRMHRKMTVVDGQIGFVGGINIIDDYNTPSQLPPRIDYAVQIEGPILPSMHASMELLWRKLCRVHLHPFRASKLKNVFTQETVGDMRATLLLRDNLWHRNEIEDAYLSAIKSAKSEILIANAYFLPGMRFRHALREAAERGVRVTLLLQGRVEYLLLDYASHALYSSLLKEGMQIYEYHMSFMHSKVAVIDDRWAMVGSSNIDPFSLLLSREANIAVKDPNFARELRQDLQMSIETGASLVTIGDWQNHYYLKRFFSWLIYGIVRALMGAAGYSNH
jgi:cardiolipin synthase A/B